MAKQPAKPALQEETFTTAPPGRSYDIVGLQLADHMPITFRGRDYDLASLSADELDYLLEFPEQVPYLKKLT